MARSSKVPEFGKWDDGEDVPYTAYFDNATKAKFERSNPNDSSLHGKEISDTVTSHYEQHKIREGVVVRRQTESPLHHDAALELPGRDSNGTKFARGQQATRQKHAQEDLSLEDGNMKKHLDSPLDHQMRGQVSFNSPLHQSQVNSATSNSAKRTMRNGAGSDCSIENSPRHPRQHQRTEAKSGVPSSPLRERRGSSSPKGGSHHDGIAPLTPGRSRHRSVPRGNETPDRSATVPKFGDWDESDPTSSENYTGIFTKVREEKQTEDGSFSAGTNASHFNSRNRSSAENPKRWCCFPW